MDTQTTKDKKVTQITKDRGTYTQTKDFDEQRFVKFVDSIIEETKDIDKIDSTELQEIVDSVISFVKAKKEVEADRLFSYLIRETKSRVTRDTLPLLNFVAAVDLRSKYKGVSKLRGFDYRDGYGSYASHVLAMVERGLYDASILDDYTRDELEEISKMIDAKRDVNFSYAGLSALEETYLVHNKDKKLVELPQERLMTAVVYLNRFEPKEHRLTRIRKSYLALARHMIGLATPTLKNSGRPHGSLSSCHIVTMADDLDNIFDVQKQVALFSKEGSGLGVYGGFLRSRGSRIRGVKVANNGIVHPAGMLSKLAEYVDQTGTRKAGIALYLPIWHADIMDFLELRLKTGTQEKRAHSIKTGLCIPDEFMRRLEKVQPVTLFDPREVRLKLGVDLNLLYDKERLEEGEEPNIHDHAFTYWYRKAEELKDLEIKEVLDIRAIYKKIRASRMNTGTPYMYYSDTSARMNPNAHAGMPLGSNLCTEIIHNMSYDTVLQNTDNELGQVIYKLEAGDLVTCNLSSQVAHNVSSLSDEEYFDLTETQFRMLDNVIEQGRLAVGQARITNQKYRAVGAGVLGMVTDLMNKGIPWESERATEEFEKFHKRYLKAAIKASYVIAMEKGSYPLYEGSDWQTGAFFDKRGLVGPEWQEYREMAATAFRFGYIKATAPTATNSIIMNGSPAEDPLYDVMYTETKSGITVLVAPPNFNNKTKWLYKSGFDMDEGWALKHIATAQKYVDQAISHNMHISENTKPSELRRLDLMAWKLGMKTIYYTHTEDREKPEDCLMCQG
ncbi:ribonucleotide reductase [Bacillus phage W.Ph.]|uniref:Ribonucleoside-diphosphate reductase n=1 Tax=Bacillus phage W.Ph. TaxID=764595 RepID=G9B1G5_9CAUD|nr:ribonucleotide reductase [Bacillus phage W.Ph.]ADH03210.1 gp64 [Bacillus phage W.Ph.]